jgi:hypothetical protein
MRGAPIIVIALPFITGCNLVNLMCFNAYNEPLVTMDEKAIEHRAEKLATDAWLDHLAGLSDSCPPDSYKNGFIDGYKDHLLHGGNAAPPTMPPVSYRRKKNLDPEGQLEVRAYFGGFKIGAETAKASGLRAFFVVPISSPLAPELRTGYDAVGRTKQPTEELPAPRQAPDSLQFPFPRPYRPSEEGPAPRPVPNPEPKQSSNRPGAAPVREAEGLHVNQQPPSGPNIGEPRQPLRSPFLPAGAAQQPLQAVYQPLPSSLREPAPPVQPASTTAAPPATELPREFNVQIQGGPASR